MASSRFDVSRVCSILAGDHGDTDFIFPGSDDELEMGDMETDMDEGGMGIDKKGIFWTEGEIGTWMQEGVGVERAQSRTRERRGAVGGAEVGAPPACTVYDAGMVHQAEGETAAGAVEVVRVVAGKAPG